MHPMKKRENVFAGVKIFICFVLISGLALSSSLNLSTVTAAEKVIYVNNNAKGTNNGFSWQDAFIDLQNALDAATEGSEIWIAEGTYFPSKDSKGNLTPEDPRAKTFQMKNELKILGGFPGDDQTADFGDRNVSGNKTILSGDLNKNNTIDDSDAYHVFYHPQGTFLNPTAVLDGVTITGGNANSYQQTDNTNGGGIFNVRSHPKLNNVTVEKNFAQSSGGGIYNQSSNMVFENGSIKGNHSNSGAGLFNVEGNPVLTASTIENNIAVNSGGGIESRQGKPLLENVAIQSNNAGYSGGGLSTSDSEISLKSVKVIGNKAKNGAGIYEEGSNFRMTGGEISSNTAKTNGSGSGGGVYSSGWNANFEEVDITNNTADSGGGIYVGRGSSLYTNIRILNNTAIHGAGVSIAGGSPQFINGKINNNSAEENGGGILTDASTSILEETIVNSNKAKNGAGMYSSESNIQSINNEFKGNQASNNGGGIYNYDSNIHLINNLISGNDANAGGGLYNNYVKDSKLTNVTIAGNDALKGGALYNSASTPAIQNSIIWGNSNSIHNSGSSPSFTYSLIQNSGGSTAWKSLVGIDLGNNIDQDPGFKSFKDSSTAPSDEGDYRLSSDSIAINKGNNKLIPSEVVKDLDGNYRIMGASVDQGAYETIVLDTTAPTWPAYTSLNVYSTDPNSLRLRWQSAKDNYEVEGYKVYQDNKLIYDLKQTELVVSSYGEYMVNDLKPNTTYNFSVEAYDKAGNSSKKLTASGQTVRELDETPPVWSADAKLKITEAPSSGVKVNWPKAEDNQGIQYYEVTVGGVSKGTYDADMLSTNLYELQPDTEYEISVMAIDYQGNSSKSLSNKYKTHPIWQEGVEIKVSETSETAPIITLPRTESGLIRYFELLVNGEEFSIIYPPGTEYPLYSLIPETEYDLTINAIDSYGKNIKTVTKKYKTLPIWQEGAELTFSEIQQASLLVTWPKVESALVGNLEILVDGKLWNYTSRNQQSEYIYNLKPDTEYEIAIRVLNPDGSMQKELKEKVKTAPYSDQEAPYWNYEDNLKVTEIKETSMKLIWPKASDNEGVKGYKVFVDNIQVADVKAGVTSHIITGLTKGTTYSLVVQAYDEKENAGFMRIGVQTASSSGGGQVIVLPPAAPTPVNPINPTIPVPVEPVNPELKLVDIKGHWAEKQIIEGIQKKMVNGYGDSTFRPDNYINRAEFTILLANALGLTGEGAELKFTDNKNIGSSAKISIERAVKAGVVQGFGDGSFRPNQKITRMEMGAMIARAMDMKGDAKAHTGFKDDSSIPAWARGSIGAMKASGIISGRGNNKFEPTVNATRAETVVMLLRMMKYQ